MLLTISLVLTGMLAQGDSAPSAPAAQEARPVLPGERGHILKMTREMIELAKTHDSDRRMDLFLGQAQERLRERDRLQKETPGEDRERLGRGLGESYTRLVTTGAAGTIECGAAEGRDMTPAGARYIERTRQLHEGWTRVLAVVPPEERSRYEGTLLVSDHAPGRVREAQDAGKAFFAQERLKDEAKSREKASGDSKPPEKTPTAAPKTPEPNSAPSVDPLRRTPEGERADGDRKDPDPDHPRKDDRDAPKPEHHPSHPHRPHR